MNQILQPGSTHFVIPQHNIILSTGMMGFLAQQTILFSWTSIQPCTTATATGICRVLPSLSILTPKHILYHHGNKLDIRKRQNQIVCMAHPRRIKMVSQQIRRELADMLLRDKVLQQAILPEIALGADKHLSSLATISDVVVSGDLQVVKVYVSIYGDERGREIAMEGLKSKNKYIRCELGKRMKLRLTPEVRFIEDDSLERGSRVIAILDKLKEESKQKVQRREESVNDDMEQGLDDDVLPTQRRLNISLKEDGEKSDEDDEGIIYIT